MPKADPQTITVAQAAALLGRSERWVHMLREAGHIRLGERGQYRVVEVVRGAMAYMDELHEKAQRKARDNRATDARTREIELRIAAREATLIGKADVIAVIDGMAEMARKEFEQLPRRAARGRNARAALAAEVEQTLDRIDTATVALVADLEG